MEIILFVIPVLVTLVVGAILFWPALFALGGTKPQEAELGRLKGEYDALQSVNTQKKCGA